ncbi:MAG TPA: hypothetical protein DCZ92_07570 [Elusimicrobia bacterium]|nr:MAG: hypothetical protein A2016_10525 [Elusimicrobia bacterium GWF2_62_30]HBA60665.1 hypothetical protein [Elusimicrobiota bacterium]
MLKKETERIITSVRRAALPPLLAALCLFAPAAVRAQEAAAVLSKGSGLYFETFLAFQKALGRPITSSDLSKEKPRFRSDLKAAVAFGSLAAAFEYPPRTKVIYLLAPGYRPKTTGGRFTKIAALPEPAQALAAYRELQPGLKRLAVLFDTRSAGAYPSELAAAAAPFGIEIIPVSLAGPSEFPDKLRGLAGKADAFWLLPEPGLINRTSLMVLSEFSCSSRMPFYAPSGGLTELGAAAAFAPNFSEAGAAAAEALKKALAGKPLPEKIYVPRPELTINEPFIKKCGLPIKLPAAGEAK